MRRVSHVHAGGTDRLNHQIEESPDDVEYHVSGLDLAETTIGLYKTEAVRKDSPLRRGPLNRPADVELLTADWVHWFNTSRLMHRLGRTPPVEYEAAHYVERATAETEAHQ